MKFQASHQRGFTLIEVIIVVALFAAMIIVLSQFYWGGHQSYKTQTMDLNVSYAGRTALDEIDTYIKQAAQTVSSYSTYSAGASTLILEIQSVNASNQLLPGAYDTVVIYLSGGKIFRTVYPNGTSVRSSGTKLLAEHVSSLTFTYNNADYSQVTQIATDLVLSETSGRDTRTLTISSKARLRN